MIGWPLSTWGCQNPCDPSSCTTSTPGPHGGGGFLPRHDEDLREPLVRRQGSQDSMRVARGSASWLSSHGRGLGPRDALKKDSRGLSQVVAGYPGFPRLMPVTSGSFSGCLCEVRDTVDLGEASRDSSGFGAMEEGLISS